MSEDVEDFLAEVEWVSKEVEGILSGKIDVGASEAKEKRKLLQKELEQQKIDEQVRKGREGKGIKFDRYKSYCKYCTREFDLETPKCTICGRDTISSEQRKEELMIKVQEYKLDKAKREENKHRWDNWKKTEALLYKKNGTNYKKWEFFEDDDEVAPEMDFIPPENDPNFAALEKDIKDRVAKRKQDLVEANTLKDQGNQFYREGKYRNAILKYESAMEFRKDLMVLYTNCAAARLRIDDFENAIKDCSKVLDYYEVFDKEFESNKETIFKALFRRGDAYRSQRRFAEAVLDYEKALEIKPSQEIENLLERCREEAAEFSLSTITEELEDSEVILNSLNTPEKIQAFRASGGYQILFKKVYESMDTQALSVLEFLMQDETKFISLQPLILPLYDKRQTAAVVMMEALHRYKAHREFATRLVALLALSIENLHIREEIATHSATTKGKKFYRQALDLFLLNPCFVQGLTPIISNLCLTVHKTAIDRKPSPGNMKSLIRYSWQGFVRVLLPLMSECTTEALGLLCNLTTDNKVKALALKEREVIERNIGVLQDTTRSLDAERAAGVMINLLTNPPAGEIGGEWEDVMGKIWNANCRIFRLEKCSEVLEDRGFKLMFRVLLVRPGLVEKLVSERDVVAYISERIDTQHADTIAKILAAATASKEFVELLDIDIIARCLVVFVQRYLDGEKIDDRVGNFCLAVGRIVSNAPESSLKFSEAIQSLIRIIKEKIGPVRKNVAVCLGKLCNNERNKEIMREAHGLEVLSSVMGFINK